MNIRCRSCQDSVWIHPDAIDSRSGMAKCRRCGQRYQIDPSKLGSSGARELAVAARKLAAENQLDLPGAYSVELGVMTLNEVQEFSAPAPSNSPPPPPPEPDAGPGDEPPRQRFDPAFAPAVAAGSLTARQAFERGRRDRYAEKIVARHGMTDEMAYEVADNRVSLLEAIRRSPAPDQATTPVKVSVPRTPSWLRLAVASTALLVVVAAFSVRTATRESIRNTSIATVGTASVTTTSDGRVLQITAPDPRSVLEAYCAVAEPAGSLEALEIVAATSTSARLRLGVFRDNSRPNELLAIAVEEDRDRNLWFAGDIGAVLAVQPAPPGIRRARKAR